MTQPDTTPAPGTTEPATPTPTTATTGVTTTVVPGDQAREPIAPERTPEKATSIAPKFTAEQQQFINDLMAERASRAAATATKTAEDRIAELEKKHDDAIKAAESKAINALVARAAANSVDPETTALLIKQRLGDLTSDNEAEILALGATVLQEKPYLAPAAGAPAAAPAPVLTPAPGVTAADNTKSFMSEAEMEAITPEELAADADKMARYIASKEQLQG